jgi:hypothetical protein
MKFAREFREALLNDGFPARWVQRRTLWGTQEVSEEGESPPSRSRGRSALSVTIIVVSFVDLDSKLLLLDWRYKKAFSGP